MIVRIGLGLLASMMLAAAAPAGTKVLKDEKGRCQAMVPAEAAVALPWMAQGPNKSYSVIVDQDGDEYKILTNAELQQFHYSRALENTSSRLIVEKESQAVSSGYRAFHVYLPLKPGRCHVGISFKTSVPEDVMKRIATSATLIK